MCYIAYNGTPSSITHNKGIANLACQWNNSVKEGIILSNVAPSEVLYHQTLPKQLLQALQSILAWCFS